MKNLYVSVVSHGHGEIISKINTLKDINKFAKVIVKNNCEDSVLVDYCNTHDITIIDSDYGLGFGENNNINYLECLDIGMVGNDFFLVLNPDVCIDIVELNKLLKLISQDDIDFFTINLHLDTEYKKHDFSIRKFPSFKTFVYSFIGFGNETIIEKSKIVENQIVEWAAGSFLCFKSELYKKLRGFNEKYFMYCEDVDICYRASLVQQYLYFIPSIKAVHLAQHSNRNILSKHFYWHLKSALFFLFIKRFKLAFNFNIKSRVP